MKSEEKNYYILVDYIAKSVVKVSATNENEAISSVIEDQSGQPLMEGLIWIDKMKGELLSDKQIAKYLEQINPLINETC